MRKAHKNADPHPPPYNVSGGHKLGVSVGGTLKGSPALLANFIPPTNNLSQSSFLQMILSYKLTLPTASNLSS